MGNYYAYSISLGMLRLKITDSNLNVLWTFLDNIWYTILGLGENYTPLC